MSDQITPSVYADSARRLLIVWWSVTGASQALAQAAFDAACSDDACEVRIQAANTVQADDLLAAHACLWVMPEMLGAMAGMMKDLFDRTYYPLLGRLEGRPYGLIVCAGSDGSGAVRQFERIVTGWRLRKVSEPMIVCTQAQTPQAIQAPKQVSDAARAEAADLGRALASGVALGIW